MKSKKKNSSAWDTYLNDLQLDTLNWSDLVSKLTQADNSIRTTVVRLKEDVSLLTVVAFEMSKRLGLKHGLIVSSVQLVEMSKLISMLEQAIASLCNLDPTTSLSAELDEKLPGKSPNIPNSNAETTDASDTSAGNGPTAPGVGPPSPREMLTMHHIWLQTLVDKQEGADAIGGYNEGFGVDEFFKALVEANAGNDVDCFDRWIHDKVWGE